MTKKIYRIIICMVCLILFTSNIEAISGKSMLVSINKIINKENFNKTKIQVSQNKSTSEIVKTILVEMDKRMNRNSLMEVEMEVYDKDEKSEYFFTMKAKDNNQYLLLRYYAPDRWKNTNMLMIKEDIWIYDAGSDRFMQVPRSLAFGGTDVAHGDVMRLNISNNYDGEIINEDEKNWIINLTANNKAVPYHGMEIVIDKDGYYPVSAKCFSKSGKHIKNIEYSEIKDMNGIKKPTKYTFLSPYEVEKYNVVKIISEKLIEYPDYIFNIWAIRDGIDEEF